MLEVNVFVSKEDREIISIFKEEFSKNIDIVFDTTIKHMEYTNNTFHLTLNSKKNETSSYTCEALLYATGRISNADTLALTNTDVHLDEKGFIQRDAMFETAVKGVYVVGDASGKHMLQHAAAAEVNHLSKVLLKAEDRPYVFKYMPHAVFTDPEVASVGMTEEAAKEQGIPYVTSTTDWLASAKAQSTRLTYPRTKFIINPDTYEILGCHLIGPESSTMIHQVLSIMYLDNDIRHLKEMVYIHPTLSESLLPAAVQAVAKVRQFQKEN